MKIISKKEWEKINQTMVNLQLDYNDKIQENALLEEQVKYLQKALENERQNNIEFINIYEVETIKYKNTIKKLKTLLTKNKIDYKSVLEKKAK